MLQRFDHNRLLRYAGLFTWAVIGLPLLLVTLPAPYIIPIFTDEPSERVQISSVLSAMTLLTMVLFAILSVVYGLQ